MLRASRPAYRFKKARLEQAEITSLEADMQEMKAVQHVTESRV
jgi:hypothetical protein